MAMGSELTFDRFVPTAGSRKAFRLAQALASHRPAARRLLFLWGPPGVGKTHLLRSIVHAVRKRQPAARIFAASADDLVHEMIVATRADRLADFERDWAGATLMVVDDLHVLSGRSATQMTIARLFREAAETGARVACAAGCHPERMPAFVAALGALPAARVVGLRPPRPSDMRRVLADMAKERGLKLSARVLASIAAQARGDVRRGIGLLTRQRFERSLAPPPG